MALPISLEFPAVSSTFPNRTTSLYVSTRRRPAPGSLPHFQYTLTAPTIRATRKTTNSLAVNAVQESEENTESEEADTQAAPPDESKTIIQPEASSANLGAEIEEALKQRKEKKEGDLLSGVADEIREIEWPAFGKVLGTTGVVIGVIAGSSVVLLTVNAILAELSDRVFAGKGVQDFFS